MKLAHLVPHPDSPAGRVRQIDVSVHLGAKGLRLSYKLEGEAASLRIPNDQGFQRGSKLWEHTCFEAFLRRKGERAYYEFNFSPSRQWDAMLFPSYRDGSPITQAAVTQVMVARDANNLRLDALVMLDRLPEPLTRPFELGLCAVIESRAGEMSYWALKHAPGRADFHHADSFALEV